MLKHQSAALDQTTAAKRMKKAWGHRRIVGVSICGPGCSVVAVHIPALKNQSGEARVWALAAMTHLASSFLPKSWELIII